MASTSDSSGKGPSKPVPEASKKPSALIDLKATEVDIKDPNQAAAKAASTVAAAASQAAQASPTVQAAPAAAAGATRSQGAAPGTAVPATAAAAAGASSNSKPADKLAGETAAAATPSKQTGGINPVPADKAIANGRLSSGGGLRGAATHLAAGLAGGLLALLGADTLLPKLRPSGGNGVAVGQAVETRLRNLEQVATRQVSPELVQRIAAAEQRTAELERASRTLSEQQTYLAGETRSLGARVAEARQSGTADDRIAKLEEILATLTAAAANESPRGRIPQLAAISGKLVDLEASLATQVSQLRKSVTQEVDSRLSQTTEAAQAARNGTLRLDREVATVKNEAALIVQRVDGLKAQGDKLEAGLQGLREETTSLKSEVSRELKQVARPADVSTALTPLTSKLSLLEQNVQGVVRSEADRRANVERIVTTLELGNLKRTIERGVAFAKELAEVRRVAGPKVDLGALERYKDKGVPAVGELDREFRSLAFSIIDAESQPAQAHWTDRLLASARSVVRVRKVDQGADDKGVEATVARIEQGLKNGRLADVIAEAGKLSEQARAPARPWLEKVEARAAVERAISAIEQDLKASLGAASQADKKG